jgi:hypothetical protein
MEDENKKSPDDKKPEDKKIKSLIESYKKSYPKEKAFHVTSDYQVFLSGDLAFAKAHQRTVDKGKKVQTIESK